MGFRRYGTDITQIFLGYGVNLVNVRLAASEKNGFSFDEAKRATGDKRPRDCGHF
jgi:hypothetical protein